MNPFTLFQCLMPKTKHIRPWKERIGFLNDNHNKIRWSLCRNEIQRGTIIIKDHYSVKLTDISLYGFCPLEGAFGTQWLIDI